MNHMDDYGFYSGKPTGIENFRERLAGEERKTEERIQRTFEEILTNYRYNKSNKEDTAKKAFKLLCSPEKFKLIIEERKIKNRNNSKEEHHTGTRLLQYPCIFFEYQYLKKKRLKGPEITHKGSTILSLFEKDQSWRPELCKEVNENNLVDAREGHLVELNKERAEEQIAMLLSTAICSAPKDFSIWKEKLNINSSPRGIQSMLRVEVIYLPFWIAKFQTAKGIDYLVCDRLGNKREAMSKTITPDIFFETV